MKTLLFRTVTVSSLLAAPFAWAASPPARALDLDEVVQDTCFVCHNDTALVGNLSLESFSVASAAEHAETAEKVIRKLRAGMMPPPEMPRPEEETLLSIVEALEDTIDRAAAAAPNPGIRSFQRLNRAEYERAIEDLLALRVDASRWLPLDQMAANFDNIAAAQTLSPTLLEAYLNAAAEAARRNFEIVQDRYTEGLVNVTDLLDAQNDRFNTERTAQAARYAFLLDLVAFQRAISWFEDVKTPEERERLLTEARAFIDNPTPSPEQEAVGAIPARDGAVRSLFDRASSQAQSSYTGRKP